MKIIIEKRNVFFFVLFLKFLSFISEKLELKYLLIIFFEIFQVEKYWSLFHYKSFS